MKTTRKILSICLSILMIVGITISGTMAFELIQQNITADDFAIKNDNHIKVQLVRQRTNESGEYVELTEEPVLYPMQTGYTENIIRVRNEGTIDTFNRVLVAVPADLDGSLELVKGDGWELTKTLLNETCNDEECNIYIFTMDGSLKRDTISEPAVLGVRLDAALEQYKGTYILNGVIYDYSEGLHLRVHAQAVQSAFFVSPESAFENCGSSENPWGASTKANSPIDKAKLNASLRTLPTGTDIAKNVTKVVFGKRADYAHITETCYGRPVDPADPNGPRAYYQPSTDGAGNTTWTIYILSNNKIYLPENCTNLFKDMTALTAVDTALCDTKFVTDMHGMFQNCGNLTSVDVSNWDISNVKSLTQMFYQCAKIDNLDVSKWDTSSVTQMTQMFNGCSSLTYLDTTNWNMSNVTGSFSYMFSNCKNLTAADVDGWVTKDTKSISFMFLNCNKLETIDVSKWDTSNVTAMDNAFNGCSSVAELDVSNWDTSKVTTTWQMFQNCSKLTDLNLNTWNTSNLENMSNMFFNCSGLTKLDLSSFNVKKVVKAVSAFNGCRNLTTIYVSADAGWDTIAESHATEVMFASSAKLVGGKGTTFRSQYGIYARIDGGTSAPGYFTEKQANQQVKK